jgi:SpoIVB peptidase S55
VILSLLFFAQLSIQAPSADAGVFQPSEVKAGQKAYGLTVFQGDVVEKFDLVLLGVLRNFLGPKKDLVIAKLTDPKLELAGVVAGMSGSPIYVDGKLLGALGYAMGAFMKEGICGITPIESMREVRDLPVLDPFTVAQNAPVSVQGYGDQLRPISAPLSIAGVDPGVLAHFMPTFERYGFVAAPGGSGGAAPSAGKTKLEPGGAVAAQLVRGDLSVAATGTVTTVDGNKVLAFGHPFMGIGVASLPMASSKIVTIIASLQRSFKMGEVGQEVGALTQDRLTAIAGELGRHASVIPLSVEIESQPEGKKNSYSFEVARDPRLTPELMQMVLANALTRRTDAGITGTVEVEGEMQLEGGDTVKLSSLMAMERDPLLPIFAALSVVRPFDVLWRNDFGGPMVKSLKVKAKLDRNVHRQHIEYMTVRQSPYAPGDTVGIELGMKADDKPIESRRLSLVLPDTLEPGDYELLVGGAQEANNNEMKFVGPMHPLSRDSLLAALQSIRTDGPLYVQLFARGGSIRMGEAMLTDVPLSFAQQIAPREGDGRASRTPVSLILEEKHPQASFTHGDGRAVLKIRTKR